LNENSFASGSSDKHICIWNSQSFELNKKFLAHGGSVRCFSLTKKDKFLISGGEDRLIKIWDKSFNLTNTLKGHEDFIRCV